jgi:glycosyltransferase involved in cell wall biosynthesis
MYRNATVSVVVPAHNEEHRLAGVLDGIPVWVDRVVIVDDGSTDGTAAVAREAAGRDPARTELVQLGRNGGVGAAIEAGYRRALEHGADVAVVMGGDGQMNPEELPALLEPVVTGEADYAKANRFLRGDAWRDIPRVRLLGNAALSLLTKIASGYWHVADSQSGYTAASREALAYLVREGLYPRYGVPNDILVKLNIGDFHVTDVPMRAVYGVGERSKMKVPRVVLPIAGLLVRLFFRRLWQKYVVRDTHPLVFFYLFGLVLSPLGALYGVFLVAVRAVLPWIVGRPDWLRFLRTLFASDSWIVLDAVLTLAGLQMLLFAMWFDMERNRPTAPTRPRRE